MTTELDRTNRTEVEVDEAKREFIKKFGKYAATAPLGMYLLMGPGASKAQASGSAGGYPYHNKWKIVKDISKGDKRIVKLEKEGGQKEIIQIFKLKERHQTKIYVHKRRVNGKWKLKEKFNDENAFKSSINNGKLVEILNYLGFFS